MVAEDSCLRAVGGAAMTVSRSDVAIEKLVVGGGLLRRGYLSKLCCATRKAEPECAAAN